MRGLARKTVEETLDALLNEEDALLAKAARCELKQRGGRPAGDERRERKLPATSGETTIKMPKLKALSFRTAIIERYRRGEASVEEAMVEMYLAGVSTRLSAGCHEAAVGQGRVGSHGKLSSTRVCLGALRMRRNRPLRPQGVSISLC